MGITYKLHKTEYSGDIITIYKDGEPQGRIRQIGKAHPDCRLEWLTWVDSQPTEHAIQFPFCYLNEITQSEIEKIVDKYLS